MDIKQRLGMSDITEYAKARMPKSHLLSECLRAFLVGGLICLLGQCLREIAQTAMGLEKDAAGGFVSICLIFLGALLTGLGIYDVIGKFAGAGSIVPITGFANSIVAPAIEFKREGFVLGVGAKLFSVAGPVLVYGISASILVGVIYFLLRCMGVAV